MSGYFDESGEYDGEQKLKRLTLGGFFAPLSAVEQLADQWRAALDDECLSAFHMKEIASDEHDYLSWPAERQRRLDRFVDILCEHATEFAAFSYVPRNPKRPFTDAYKPAIARIIIVAETLSEQLSEPHNIVFAKSEEIKAELIGRFFDRLRWNERLLGGFSVLSSRYCPALQAAEIVARGLKRVMQDGGITHSFSRILTCRKPCRFWPEAPFAAVPFHPHLLGAPK